MPGSLPVTITSPTGGTTIDTRHRRRERHDHGWCEGRRGSVRVPGRGGGDRVDHRGWIGQLVAEPAGELRLEHDHGDRDARRQHGLCAGVGVQLARAGDDGVQHDATRPATTTGLARTPTRPRRTSRHGSFDLTGMRINQTDSDVFITFTFRTLVPTFGNAFGAQMLDVYVHNPAATTTSTARGVPAAQLHDRARRRLERAGGGSGIRRRRSGSMPPATGSARRCSCPTTAPRRRRSSLPIAQFGTVGPGWTFTVALTGQDGFSPDQARGFAPTPQDFAFGVCQPGGIEPDLRGGPGDGAQGDGHVHAGGRRPEDRA